MNTGRRASDRCYTGAVPGPEVLVAVVSFQTRELLRGCLRSLAESGATVCVVDNGSTDGSPDMVREEFPDVRLVEPGRNLGFGAAVNLAAAGSPGCEVVVAANADVEVQPGAVDELVGALRHDPGAGAAAPRLVLPGGTVQHSVFPFPGVAFGLAFLVGLERLRALGDRWCVPGRWDPERARRVPWAVGAFLAVRREAWDAVGGFDEWHWMYAEDLDLGWRLRRAGWATRYVPSAVVRHHESAATAAAFGGAGRRERWQRETYAWLARRRGRPVARLVALLAVLGALTHGSWSWARLHARTGLLAPR
jgi:N-acetylglucosaminyl-diphospho-decaprenol L-rhamnosyltransferase